jgi:hypothetical protein
MQEIGRAGNILPLYFGLEGEVIYDTELSYVESSSKESINK